MTWMTLKLILLAAIVVSMSFATLASGGQNSLPDKPGRQTVERVCSACHDLDTAIGARHTRADWQAIVAAMVNRGATATDDEVAGMIEYLATSVGLVNVNRAAAEEIAAVLAIPSGPAAEIVRYRAEHGEFKDLDSLKSVPGVEATVLEERKDRIAFR
jgi:competence protein ComEA